MRRAPLRSPIRRNVSARLRSFCSSDEPNALAVSAGSRPAVVVVHALAQPSLLDRESKTGYQHTCLDPGNKFGGRKPIPEEVKELARAATKRAIKRQIELIESKDENI